uniref:Uncharacterized protein n=1 Tax=Chlorocebus sabaeus TaxID=60711 RepID=A0A0D9RY44_CHLSB
AATRRARRVAGGDARGGPVAGDTQLGARWRWAAEGLVENLNPPEAEA